MLINEFGEMGLDHDLVTPIIEDVVVETSSGCLCCSVRGDLVRVLSEVVSKCLASTAFPSDGKSHFQ